MEQSNHIPSHSYGAAKRTAPAENLIGTLAAGDFSTLLSCLKATGLTETLMGNGPLTVFAPTDEAFKKLPAGALAALRKDVRKLKAVLSFHVVAGHLLAKDLKSSDVMTLQGTALAVVVASSGVAINGARLQRADLEATNGVVQVIDAVILPRHWQWLPAAA